MADAPAPDGAAPPGNPDGRRSRVNFTLKPSPATSHTQGLLDRSIGIMERNGVSVDVVRAVDLDLPPGVYPGMREHGFESDGWRAPAGRTTTSPTGTRRS